MEQRTERTPMPLPPRQINKARSIGRVSVFNQLIHHKKEKQFSEPLVFNLVLFLVYVLWKGCCVLKCLAVFLLNILSPYRPYLLYP